MGLRKEQSLFVQDLVMMIHFAWQSGFDVVLGEVERPLEMQRIYVQTGRSKTLEGYHLKRLAADVHFFDRATGAYILDKERLQPVGDYWQSLSPKNSWGGNWNSFKDVPHFERRA